MIEGAQRGKLCKWIRSQLYAVAETQGRFTKIVIRHAKAGKLGAEIGIISIPKKASEDTIESIAADIDSQLVGESGFSGIQKYLLLPYFADREKPLGRFVLRIRIEDEDEEEGDELGSEGPSIRGIASQQMRHNEALMRTHTVGTGQIISQQARIIQRQQDQIEVMQAKHIELMVTLEQLITGRHERDLESRRLDFSLKNKQEMVSRLMLLAPNVINRLGGKKMLPEKTTPVEQMIRGLLEGLDKDRMMKIMDAGIFNQDEIMTLLSVGEHFRKQEEAAIVQAAANGANGTTKEEKPQAVEVVKVE